MALTIEAWLADHRTIWCPHLRLRCLPGHCARLRRRPGLKIKTCERYPSYWQWEDERAETEPIQPSACARCRGKDKVRLEAARARGVRA